MQASADASRSITVLPAPKDVDPHVLVWKGASVLGKMDGVADLWLTAADWVCALFEMYEPLLSIPRRTFWVCADFVSGASSCKQAIRGVICEIVFYVPLVAIIQERRNGCRKVRCIRVSSVSLDFIYHALREGVF